MNAWQLWLALGWMAFIAVVIVVGMVVFGLLVRTRLNSLDERARGHDAPPAVQDQVRPPSGDDELPF